MVYKLSQKCLDQEEEIQNLIKNITVMQEVIEKKDNKINELEKENDYLRKENGFYRLSNNIEYGLGDLDQEVEQSFENVFSIVNEIMDKLEEENTNEIEQSFKDLINTYQEL